MTEDKMVGWHHWLNGPESEQTPGDSEGKGNLGHYSLCGCRVRHNLVNEQQTNLFKRLLFPQLFILVPLPQNSLPYKCGSISELYSVSPI